MHGKLLQLFLASVLIPVGQTTLASGDNTLDKEHSLLVIGGKLTMRSECSKDVEYLFCFF